MKKFRLSAGIGMYLPIFLIFAFTSCTKDNISTEIAGQETAGRNVVRNAAEPFIENIKVPVTLVAFIPCANDGAGEDVEFSGNLHFVFKSHINDNNVRSSSHAQPMGLKGVGADTGDEYKATGVTMDSFSGSLNNGKVSFSSVNNFRLIGPGPGNNLLVHFNTKFNVNANGEVTADVVNTSIDCK